LLSLAVSAVFIFLSLRHTDLGAVAGAIATAHLWPVLGYLAILLFVHLLKTMRWGLLLRPLGPVSFKRLNSASAVGLMLVVLLPLRLGELARPLLVARPSAGGEAPLSRSGALASCVVERVVDSLAVGVLGIVSLRLLATTGQAADFARHAATLVTIGFAALCMALIAAFFLREGTVTLIRRVLAPLSRPLADRVAKVVDGFLRGLHFGSPVAGLAFLGLTAAYWSLHVLGFWMVATAFDLEITGLMACTVLACQVVGIMIPAGPGMVGTSQFFTQLGLSIFIPGALTVAGVTARVAGYANTIWLLQFGQQVLLGLVFLVAGHVSLAGLFKPWKTEPSLPQEGAEG